MPVANIRVTPPSNQGSTSAELRDRLFAQAQAEKAQIHHQRGPRRQSKTQEVEGLDHREESGRIPDPHADRR